MDNDAYRSIIEACFPPFRVHSVTPASEGWDSVALEVNGQYIFRFPQDLNPEHILHDPSGETLAGVIDWGDAAIGDPALDFAGLLNECGAEFTEQTLAGYRGAVDATFRSRLAFYARIIPFHEVLFGLAIGDEGHVRQGLKELRGALEAC